MPDTVAHHLASERAALPDFTPPPRFGTTNFENYRPQHPSQHKAVETVRRFVSDVTEEKRGGFRWPWQKPGPEPGRGLYLDGGFGVGKTHLLAATYHACDAEQKAYLSFQELVYTIGVLGMERAKRELGYKLFCIDEFELDDPGNTLIVKTFLSHAFRQGAYVITTSNTPPEAQGQGRFNAGDFKREIQSIAERFEVLPIEGPDYRKRDHLAELPGKAEWRELLEHEGAPEPKVALSWSELSRLLEDHHPIRYADILGQIGTLYLKEMRTIPDQNGALRFVHFIDKLYDLKVGLRMTGELALEQLFHPSYYRSAYLKKHERCLSRLSELLEESYPSKNAPNIAP